jgi:transcriptional regulator with XRE-family HTH domain
MGKSNLKHPVAVLRNLIGLGQKELAELVGYSTITIQSIELGKLGLSRALAERIAEETGVDPNWLLANDVKKPIVDYLGYPYTKMTYQVARLEATDEMAFAPDWTPIKRALFNVAQAISAIFSLSIEAAQKGKSRFVQFRLAQSLRDLKEEMGFTRPLAIEKVWYAGKDISRFNIQKVADSFWPEMIAACKAGAEVTQARAEAAAPKTPAQPRSTSRRAK